jgi:hypothetical protein
VTVPMPERAQFPDVARRTLRVEANRLHPPAVNDEEERVDSRKVLGSDRPRLF